MMTILRKIAQMVIVFNFALAIVFVCLAVLIDNLITKLINTIKRLWQNRNSR